MGIDDTKLLKDIHSSQLNIAQLGTGETNKHKVVHSSQLDLAQLGIDDSSKHRPLKVVHSSQMQLGIDNSSKPLQVLHSSRLKKEDPNNLTQLRKITREEADILNRYKSLESLRAAYPLPSRKLALGNNPMKPRYGVPLTQAVIDKVQKFVLFIGYPRSGHSVIGSFMDAHPNMIIAHEFPLFKTLTYNTMSKKEIFDALYKRSQSDMLVGWRGRKNMLKKGYSLSMIGQWQATFNELKVIGNKHGGSTVQLYRTRTKDFLAAFEYLKVILDIPIYALHVVRNPFDMIATQTLYLDSGKEGVKTQATEERKFDNVTFLRNISMDILGRAEAAAELIDVLKIPTLEIHSEDLILHPMRVMKLVCTFVGVESSNSYLEACKNNTFPFPIKSRNTVVWPQSLINQIHDKIKQIPFFQRYSFSS